MPDFLPVLSVAIFVFVTWQMRSAHKGGPPLLAYVAGVMVVLIYTRMLSIHVDLSSVLDVSITEGEMQIRLPRGAGPLFDALLQIIFFGVVVRTVQSALLWSSTSDP